MKVALSDSFAIAEYLDNAYTDSPRVLPEDLRERAEQRTFADTFWASRMPMFALVVLALFPIMNEASRELFSKSSVVPISGKWKAERLEDPDIEGGAPFVLGGSQGRSRQP